MCVNWSHYFLNNIFPEILDSYSFLILVYYIILRTLRGFVIKCSPVFKRKHHRGPLEKLFIWCAGKILFLRLGALDLQLHWLVNCFFFRSLLSVSIHVVPKIYTPWNLVFSFGWQRWEAQVGPADTRRSHWREDGLVFLPAARGTWPCLMMQS